MDVARMLRQWRGLLQARFTDLHGHQVKALALLSLGMALAGSCQLTRVAPEVAIGVHIDSVRRRLERLIANRRLRVSSAMGCLARAVLEPWAGRRVMMLLDETPLSNTLRCMKLSVGYRGRAVPVAWVCYRPDHPPTGLHQIIGSLIDKADRCLPEGARPVLLTDRGLSWPWLIRLAHRRGWRVLMRVQGQTRVRLADGTTKRMDQLVPRPGCRYYGRAEVFRDAGWIELNLAAHYPSDGGDAWLLVTDLEPTAQRFDQYRRRMHQEQAFKDEKTGGFRWNDSRVHRPAHAQRLLLGLAVAMWLALSLGSRVIKRGWRKQLGRARTSRQYSYFRLGLRWLSYCLNQANPPPLTLQLYPQEAKKKSVG